MQAQASFFIDDSGLAALAARVPDAVVNSGMMYGASCAPGIGISTENPGLAESLPNWTLLDQFGDARANQISQHIGGAGISDPGTSSGDSGTDPASTIRLAPQADMTGDGALAFPKFGAELTDLAAGWEVGI